MPSWPSRLLLGTSAPSNTPLAPHPPGHESLPGKHGQHKTTLRREAPTSASTNASSSSTPNRPIGHSRSLSHPSTTPINGDRRTNKKLKGRDEFDGLENIGDNTSDISLGFARDHMFAGHNGSLQHDELELISGKCATCGSLVRWPKSVNVFRCSVCLMVNDLSPAPKAKLAANASHREKTTGAGSRCKVTYLSIERSKALVEQCLSQYLQARLAVRSRSREYGGLVTSQGIPLTTTTERIVYDNRDVRCTEARIPTISTVAGHPGCDELLDASQQYQLTSGPTPIYPLSSANPVGHHSPNANARCATDVMPSPIRKSPLPPIKRSDNVPNDISLNDRLPDWGSPRAIFRPLENYILACFNTCDCLNASFLTPRPSQPARAVSEGANITASPTKSDFWRGPEESLPGLDAKTLLVGDFAENGMWWTGGSPVERYQSHKYETTFPEEPLGDRVNLKTARINWIELSEWYHVILSAGQSWQRTRQELEASSGVSQTVDQNTETNDLRKIKEEITDASLHLQKTLLKATESLLRRPGRPLEHPEDCRFLLILLANPILYPPESIDSAFTLPAKMQRSVGHDQNTALHVPCSAPRLKTSLSRRPPEISAGNVGKHSGIIKRILGLLSNTSLDCNHHFVVWFSRLSEAHFRKLVDLVGSFVTYRLGRQHGMTRGNSYDPDSGLIPNIAGPGAGGSAQLHAALAVTGPPKLSEKSNETIVYGEDWQIKAAARVMSLLFSANNRTVKVRHEATRTSLYDSAIPASVAQQRARSHSQLLPTNSFYNTLLDYSDLIADFETWESRRGKFSFCQYPMFLSIWAKIHIMEYDARRQMEIKAREAFFTSIMNRKAVNQHLVLRVRRNCLVEDSLRGVSEAVGTGQEEIKKGLRIEFLGEEGIDAGGLRKEWFLLLVREVFDAEHGLFTYDEESHYCYFNPNSFETSDQFYLVGAVLGLAIYNSTILDVAFPPFVFRKLLASAPNYSGPATSSSRPAAGSTLEDLAEFRPSLAKGLAQLLDYDGDVEETYCWDFVTQIDRYGQSAFIQLCPNGGDRPVTNTNRREFVDLYVKYLLDTAVARQFEPFKRGFFTVCAGNALSLFRPEEIELLVRGSDEPLDVATLQTVAVYDGWGNGIQAKDEPVVTWFWDTFANADFKSQRKLLSFITSSDRIPAMGATNLVLKITCLGGNCDRFPIARTCFNMIGIYRYQSRQVFETKLWRAIIESEGFGLR